MQKKNKPTALAIQLTTIKTVKGVELTDCLLVWRKQFHESRDDSFYELIRGHGRLWQLIHKTCLVSMEIFWTEMSLLQSSISRNL